MNEILTFLGAALLVATGYVAAQWRAGRGTMFQSALPVKIPTIQAAQGNASTGAVDRFADAMDRFHRWLAAQTDPVDPWPAFGEFVRAVLHECCGATHVKIYRLSSNGKELIALRDPNPLVQTDSLSVRRGIVGHVVTSGRSYIAGDPSHGKLIEELAEGVETQIVWCFPVQRGSERLGVVTVGHCDLPAPGNKSALTLAEKMVVQFWWMAASAVRTRTLEQFDPICGLLSRPSFLRMAQQALSEAYHEGAPVAVAVLALEGLRGMNDSGRWETADELLQEISKLLRAKVRAGDLLGRFDGSRFVILLRRVDSELATLIVRQLIAQLSTICGDSVRWGAPTQVRCGLTGSGTDQPTMRTLVSQALSQSQRAREQNRLIAADVFENALVESPA
jgi:diguanylate cyclase (GGDEF)-like protein